MPVAVVAPRRKGFIMVNAHPEGCRAEVERQFDIATSLEPRASGSALVVGSSTGYGLASRICAVNSLALPDGTTTSHFGDGQVERRSA